VASAPDAPAVILTGGGLDSSILLARELERRSRLYPLYVRQGTVWEKAEETVLRHFLEAMESKHDRGRLAPLRVMRLDLPEVYASQWALNPAIEAPDEKSPDEAVYLPGRNLALLFSGALLAQSLGVSTILIGLLAGNPFSDSRPLFFQSFEQTYALATQYQIRILTPLGSMHKEEVIRSGTGLPLQFTFSCLRPVDARHCGHCNKCAERQRGFARAGIADPTLYHPGNGN
jgi:7-cyano-7-deazaguanine synthase